jgi:hypothetical protein
MDELADIIRLAGVNEFKGYTEYTLENMSQTATAIKQKERDNNIKPGDKEWFELWFSKPYMTGHTFRGRTKK